MHSFMHKKLWAVPLNALAFLKATVKGLSLSMCVSVCVLVGDGSLSKARSHHRNKSGTYVVNLAWLEVHNLVLLNMS